MKSRAPLLIVTLLFWGLSAQAKIFKNSYISFEVPDDWVCMQEGVAWTCTPRGAAESKEAVIVLAAKVAGPEDNLNTFLNFLKQPKKIMTKVGTPMPSKVMYAQQRNIEGQNWVQAQHLGSEIQEFYTLYLATVKSQLAILVSFSAERTRYQVYNPIFDKAVRTLKITANQQLLFPKPKAGNTAADSFGIQVPSTGGAMTSMDDILPPPEHKSHGALVGIVLLVVGAAIAVGAYIFTTRRKKISHSKSKKSRPK